MNIMGDRSGPGSFLKGLMGDRTGPGSILSGFIGDWDGPDRSLFETGFPFLKKFKRGQLSQSFFFPVCGRTGRERVCQRQRRDLRKVKKCYRWKSRGLFYQSLQLMTSMCSDGLAYQRVKDFTCFLVLS